MKFSSSSPLQLTHRFDDAVAYATIIHAGQLRKGTGIPYIAHLLGVTAIALEFGADEDEAIAALLHDAAEDVGGQGRIADIRSRCGDKVSDIVEGCTDPVVTRPKVPWRERKEAYGSRASRPRTNRAGKHAGNAALFLPTSLELFPDIGTECKPHRHKFENVNGN